MRSVPLTACRLPRSKDHHSTTISKIAKGELKRIYTVWHQDYYIQRYTSFVIWSEARKIHDGLDKTQLHHWKQK